MICRLTHVLAMTVLAAGADFPVPNASINPARPPELAAPSSSWTIRGRVKVEHMMPELEALAPAGSALEGIEVKVSAKERIWGFWGWYNGWDTVVTDGDGDFSITQSLSDNKRRFKVEVRFHDRDLLEIRHEHSTSSPTKVKWYLVYESDTERSPGTIDLGTFTFRSGASHELNDSEPRHHADIWVLAQKAMAQLASYGSSYEFGSQVMIKYPHDSWFGAVEHSYANPYTRVIYIQEDEFNAKTILHEMMHIWSYDHGTGEAVLAETLLGGDTHGSTNAPTAFLEAFAEYAARELLTILFGAEEQLPLNRYYLSNTLGLTNLNRVQKHDDGWLSLFAAMTCSDLFYRDFLEASAYSASPVAIRLIFVSLPWGATIDVPALDLKDLLTVFNAKSSAGYPDPIAFRDVTMTNFLERAAAILSKMKSEDATRFQALINPPGTQQPAGLFLAY